MSRESFGEADMVSLTKTGETAVGYFGSDQSVKSQEQFVVRNTGDAGVAMRALVILG